MSSPFFIISDCPSGSTRQDGSCHCNEGLTFSKGQCLKGGSTTSSLTSYSSSYSVLFSVPTHLFSLSHSSCSTYSYFSVLYFSSSMPSFSPPPPSLPFFSFSILFLLLRTLLIIPCSRYCSLSRKQCPCPRQMCLYSRLRARQEQMSRTYVN